jgi:Zn-dependent protease
MEISRCPSCGRELEPGALACSACFALVHGEELNERSRQAQELEAKGSFAEAREAWNGALALLPPDSKQAQWVRERLRALEMAHAAQPDSQGQTGQTGSKPQHPWARRLGPLAPIAIVLAKSKGLLLALFKLKFLLSFFAFLWLYVLIFGWRFGVGFAVSILIHEMGHFIDIKRRGLPAEMPVFLPGLGAFVRWRGMGVTPRQIAQISLAGPLAGWLTAAACFLLYAQTHDLLWAALARTGCVLNLLNLVPVWTLDGGQAASALGFVERLGLLAATLLLWLYTGEGIFFLVALGVCWRLYTKDKPEQDDWGTWLYFVAVMTALGLTLHAVPDALAGWHGQK